MAFCQGTLLIMNSASVGKLWQLHRLRYHHCVVPRSPPAGESKSIPRHQHLEYECLLVRAGVYRCELNGESLELHPGSILLVQPGDWHQDELTGPIEYAAVVWSLPPQEDGTHDRFFRSGDIEPIQQVCTDRDGACAEIVKRLEIEESGQRHSGLCRSLTESLIWLLFREFSPDVLISLPQKSSVEQLRACFHHHMAGSATVAELAEYMGMSERSFTRWCQRMCQMSPAAAFRQARVTYAAELIRGTDMTLAEIAEFVGFSSAFHLSSSCRQVLGQSPTQIRNRR